MKAFRRVLFGITLTSALIGCRPTEPAADPRSAPRSLADPDGPALAPGDLNADAAGDDDAEDEKTVEPPTAPTDPVELTLGGRLVDDGIRGDADACRGGDADACYRVAWALASPDTGAPDWNAAFPWGERACQAGQAKACAFLGLRHQHGRGPPRDVTKAFAYYERACELGEIEVSCLNGANILYDRKGATEADKARALDWYTAACEEDVPQGCFNVALVRSEQGATRLEYDHWLKRACDLGLRDACGFVFEPSGPPTPSSEPAFPKDLGDLSRLPAQPGGGHREHEGDATQIVTD